MSRCDCHDLLTADCEALRGAETRQRGEQRAEQARWRALLDKRGIAAAGFAGTCGGCRSPFTAGTPIKAMHGPFAGDAVWVAACCLDDDGNVDA